MKTQFYIHTLLVATLVFLSACTSDENELPDIENYSTAFNFFEAASFNGSVLISKNGDDIFRGSFGLANKETGILNDLETKFRIGSVSKTLTGMGIIQLKREGLITDFNQPLSDFDTNLPQANQITISHLLSHQSGIPDYLPLVEKEAKSGEQISAEEIYEEIKLYLAENDLDFTPGSSMAYSNSNFLIVALLIEELSGESYENYIKSRILNPLNMMNTEMGTETILGANYAQGYNQNVNVSQYPMAITLGAGCWTSTVSDLEKWCQAVMGNDWFSADEKELIFEGQVPNESTIFGLAWFKSKVNGKTFCWHGGDIDGFSSLIGFLPEQNGIIITLGNKQDNTGKLRNRIIETIISNEF
ncbi:serine hydrolase domain-containing protein [uncultured Draconibacterium sp.]|uniref:serine hydrolase domain-containing protein n=1 Tax=uncultured Draconibacterium sp. TaxID=1573823 RepID=UPI0025E4EF55|nr:serine hydrolase domain-containing protein [uncultured Draconibacterium sp.]